MMVEFGGGHIIFGEMVLGSFMISRPHYVHSNEPVGERQRRNVIFLIFVYFRTTLPPVIQRQCSDVYMTVPEDFGENTNGLNRVYNGTFIFPGYPVEAGKKHSWWAIKF